MPSLSKSLEPPRLAAVSPRLATALSQIYPGSVTAPFEGRLVNVAKRRQLSHSRDICPLECYGLPLSLPPLLPLARPPASACSTPGRPLLFRGLPEAAYRAEREARDAYRQERGGFRGGTAIRTVKRPRSWPRRAGIGWTSWPQRASLPRSMPPRDSWGCRRAGAVNRLHPPAWSSATAYSFTTPTRVRCCAPSS